MCPIVVIIRYGVQELSANVYYTLSIITTNSR